MPDILIELKRFFIHEHYEYEQSYEPDSDSEDWTFHDTIVHLTG